MDRREFLSGAAALGLTAGSATFHRLLAETSSVAQIRGHVVCGDEPIRNARVSDGCRVATTNSSGQFSLEVGPDSGPFVFLTIPAGYWTNAFYVPTASAVKQSPLFRLSRRNDDDQYTAVYVTDVHLGEGRSEQSYLRFAATLDELNRLDPLPAVCWVGGDITLQGGKGERYVEVMSRLKMPVRNAVGNHEMLVRETDPRHRFEQLFGPTYYSFDIGKVHYITLDGCHVRPKVEGYKNVEGLLSDRELRWLANDLKHIPEGMATVASIHIPLVSDYPARRDTTAANVPWWVVRNADEVVDMLAKHGVTLVLQGHLHENQRMIRQGIEFVESISVCGRWWKAAEGSRENGVSGEPRGYRILDVKGSTIRHTYQSTAEAHVDAIGEIVGTPAHLAAHQDTVLAVNVFDPAPLTVVEGQLDEGPPERLVAGTKLRYHENLQPTHHWEWPIRAKSLTPGRHSLRVHVRDSHGRANSFEQPFVV